MHYLVTLEHPPSLCALGSPERKAAMLAFLTDADGSAAAWGVTIDDAWVDTVGHQQFYAVSADSAGAIESWLIDSGIALTNTIHIRPVRTRTEAAELFGA
ncbi:MAG: hypothetical protein KY469_11765 [Actinobacteria bacterium]|nr:hypothetical protein [Actinomycetota bacterium]